MMEYPPTTHYLIRKLNWMARKLKSMIDPSAIKDWTEAMNYAFKTLEAFSGNRDLSTPTQMAKRKVDINRALSINIISLQ